MNVLGKLRHKERHWKEKISCDGRAVDCIASSAVRLPGPSLVLSAYIRYVTGRPSCSGLVNYSAIKVIISHVQVTFGSGGTPTGG